MWTLRNRTLLLLALASTGLAGVCPTDAQERLAQAVDGGGSIGGSIDVPARTLPRPVPRIRPKTSRPAPAPAAVGGQAARPPAPEHRAASRKSPSPSFDGAWSVSSDGPCASAGSSQVTIAGSRIIGQTGVSGRVSPSGAVRTLGSFNGLTVEGKGQIVGSSASGMYHQSDGCSGSWTAIKL